MGTSSLVGTQVSSAGGQVLAKRGPSRVESQSQWRSTPARRFACVADRVLQQAIAQIIGPIFEGQFSDDSFGFRPGRNAHQAVRQVREYLRQGNRAVVDIDLAAFFDSVNHDVLMRLVAQRVKDKRVLRLIGRYLRAGVIVDGVRQPTPLGVPQGGPLSPLLANIVLHELDRYLEAQGRQFARYADDFVICVRTEEAFEAQHQP